MTEKDTLKTEKDTLQEEIAELREMLLNGTAENPNNLDEQLVAKEQALEKLEKNDSTDHATVSFRAR